MLFELHGNGPGVFAEIVVFRLYFNQFWQGADYLELGSYFLELLLKPTFKNAGITKLSGCCLKI